VVTKTGWREWKNLYPRPSKEKNPDYTFVGFVLFALSLIIFIVVAG